MPRFEPMTSGIGSDCSANGATNTTPKYPCLPKWAQWMVLYFPLYKTFLLIPANNSTGCNVIKKF